MRRADGRDSGGEPLIHKEIGEIVAGIVARKKFVSLCTNALLLEKKLHLFEPSPYLFFSVHLDGIKKHHDKSVCMEGGFEKAIAGIKAAKAKGFIVNVNCTVFDGHPAEDIAAFLDLCKELGVGVSISPATPMSAHPTRSTSSAAARPRSCSATCSRAAKGRGGSSSLAAVPRFPRRQPDLSLPALGHADAQHLRLAEALLSARRRLREDLQGMMDKTDWDAYGTGRYEKCANCMAHCGYEPTAAESMLRNPIRALQVAIRGPQTEGVFAAEIPLDSQRPAQYVFSGQVQQKLSEMRRTRRRKPRRRR